MSPDTIFALSYSRYRPDWTLENWRLTLCGLVEERELILTWAGIQSLPQTEKKHTLECIDNAPGGDLIANALWQGVLFPELIKNLTIKPQATRARLCAWDGYQTAVDLHWLYHPDTLLATGMNGQPLSLEHGFPARLLIPGLYGQKMPKWLQRVEFIGYDFRGTWESRGWPDAAEILPHAMIKTPVPDVRIHHQTTFEGTALAGLHSIERVEVRVDGGEWMSTQVQPGTSPQEWARWSFAWIPEAAGVFSVEVRAVDSAGRVQQPRAGRAKVQFNRPEYHRITVRVSA